MHWRASSRLAHGEKNTTTQLANRVTLVQTNRATHGLGLVVMSVGIFYRLSMHSSFVENILQEVKQVGVRESEENGE